MNNRCITSFFERKRTNGNNEADNVAQSSPSEPLSVEVVATAPGTSESSATNSAPLEQAPQWDIGRFVDQKINRDEKYQLLTNPWIPTNSYVYPTKIRLQSSTSGAKKARILTYQPKWRERFSWLTFSHRFQGAFCNICVLFSTRIAGGNTLKTFITQPLTNWKDAIELCSSHATTKYHEDCQARAVLFKESHVSGDVCEKLSADYDHQKAKHRLVVKAVIETVKLCARQNIALRGKSDSGSLDDAANFETIDNEGNFRAILRLVVSHDYQLENAINSMPRNATYLSPVIQNEIVEVCGEMVRDTLIAKIKKAGLFSVLADETSDISQLEQFSICIRYVDEDTDGMPSIREDFIGYQSATDLTGENLASQLLSTLREFDLDPSNIRGQGYDGASNMSGKFRGVQTRIREAYPMALYTHCSSHCLSLCFAKASTLPALRKLFATVSDVCNFFRSSPKRTDVLQNAISAMCPDQQRKKLKPLCETRWVERHESLLIFDELYLPILHSLQQLQNADAAATAAKADQLRISLIKFNFLITLRSAVYAFGGCINISRALQSPSCDLIGAVEMIMELKNQYEEDQVNAEATFNAIFVKAAEFAQLNDRVFLNSSVGTRHQNEDKEIHYRSTIFMPMIGSLIHDISIRFDDLLRKAAMGYSIIPAFIEDHNAETDIRPFFELYACDLPSLAEVHAELRLWTRKWKNCVDSEARPKTAICAMKAADPLFFPSIRNILKILATLPVTTASAERSFSTLARTKTYLRNSMSGDRLTGLALMNVHRDIEVNTEAVLQKFSISRARRLKLNI